MTFGIHPSWAAIAFLIGFIVGAGLISFAAEQQERAVRTNAYSSGLCAGRGGEQLMDGGCVKATPLTDGGQ